MLRLLPLLLLLAGCGARAATLDEAKALVQSAYPDSVAISRLVETTDLGDRWRLIYTSQSTAGTSVFEVDKRHGTVVPTRLEQ
jgi:hypothetical protein